MIVSLTMCFSAKHAINKSAMKRRNVFLPLNPLSPFLLRKKSIDLGKFKFFNLKKILEKNLTKIQEYFLFYNNL